jgi:hypothetical protein
MIKGINKKSIQYVLEDDRNSPLDQQTVFSIRPKTGHDSNQTLQRYAAAAKEGRGGKREINVNKLDSADVEEFLNIVEKVENYGFPEGNKFYNDGQPQTFEGSEKEKMIEVVNTLSSDYLQEVFEAANNLSRLKEGQKKGFSS